MEKAIIKLTEPLNGRELEILRRIARGQSSTQIARAMNLRPNTILWYRKRLHLKFDVHSIAELVVAATEQGIL